VAFTPRKSHKSVLRPPLRVVLLSYND
jgi:hypothetical protein